MQFYRRPQFNGNECLTVQPKNRYDDGRSAIGNTVLCNAVQFLLFLYSLKHDAQPSQYVLWNFDLNSAAGKVNCVLCKHE